MKITVRNATESDALGIFKLCVDMHTTTLYSKYRFNPEKTISQVLRWIESALVLIAIRVRDDSTEDVVGMMIATRRDLWFSDDAVVGENILFVRSDARGTRAALLLVDGYLDWAREQNVVDARAGVTTADAGPAAGRIYEHLGMTNVGSNYVLDLQRS